MIKNACPFAPGEVKPEQMPAKSTEESLVKRILNKKTLLLVFCFCVLTFLYTRNYNELYMGGSSILFQDGYIIKMSFYTYISGLLAFYIREHRRKQVNQ